MFKTFPIVLDVTKHQLNDMFQVNSNDLNTVRLNLSIKSGLEIFDLTGKIVRIAIKKPDGFIAFQTGGVTDPSNGLCEFILDRQAYLVEGKHEAEVMIYQDDSTVIVTERFYYKVNRAIANDKTLISTNHLPAINQAIIAGEQLKDIDIPEFVEAANSAYETIEEAETQGLYAKGQGDYAKQEADRAAARVTELNGVDAVQFKDRQDGFDSQLTDISSMKINMASYKRLAPETKDTPRVQRAIDAAPEYSTIVFETNKTYELGSLVSSKSLTIDLNGCKIIADITDTSGNGTPLILFKGTLIDSTKSVITNATENNQFVTLSTISDSSKFAVGDYVFINDTKVIQPWDAGQMGGVAYANREEINMITAIDGTTGKITLASPIEWSYDTSPRITKFNALIQPSIIGKAEITEVDPGVEYTGNFPNGQMPHIFQFRYCVNPFVKEVNFKQWQLEAINFSYCWNPLVEKCYARDPYRIDKGGHGYFVRLERCRGGLTTKNTTKNVRHTVDYVQSYDGKSSYNVSINCMYGHYMTHGLGSKRCESTSDTAIGGGFGWVMGNPTFNADYDFTINNPSYIGEGNIFLMCALSDRMIINNPKVKTSTRGFVMNSGAKNMEVNGGTVHLTANTTNFETVLARSKAGIADAFGLAPSNIRFKNVKFKGRSILYIDVLGDIDILDCMMENNDGAVNAIRIANGNIPTNLRINDNDIRGAHSISITNDVAPTGVYEINRNRTKDHTYVSPIYVYAANNLKAIGNNFIGATSLAWRGDIVASVNGGAIVKDNTPIISNRDYLTSISSTPLRVGQEALVSGVWYKAIGTTAATDWVENGDVYKSLDGSQWKLTIGNDGALTTTKL